MFPDSAVELDDQCFHWSRLPLVTSGALSKLERIGVYAVTGARIESVTVLLNLVTQAFWRLMIFGLSHFGA